MKFQINGGNLARALERVFDPVDLKTPSLSPVLRNVRVQAGVSEEKGGRLRLSMNDLTIAAVTEVEADVAEPGDVLIDAEKLLGLAKNSRTTNLDIRQSGQERTVIYRGDREFKLPYTNPLLFPAIARAGGELCTLDVHTFNYLVDRALYAAAATDQFRALTDAVHFEKVDGLLCAVAYSGSRMSICRAPYEGAFTPLTVARPVVAKLREITAAAKIKDGQPVDEVETIQYSEGPNAVEFFYSGLFITVRKMAQDYPNWQSLVPAKADDWPRLRLKPLALLDALNDITIIRGEDVTFRFSRGANLELEERAVNVGAEATARLEAVLENAEEVTFRLNARQAIDYLAGLAKGIPQLEGEVELAVSERAVYFRYLNHDRRVEYLQSTVHDQMAAAGE